MKILILYYTKTGHTLEAAKATAEGIESAGSEVTIVPVAEFSADSIAEYAGIILGSPCWAGSLTHSGIARPLSKIIKALPSDSMAMKRCGGISVHSRTGGTHTVKALGELLSRKGCSDYRPGPAARAGVPLSLWKGPSLSPDDKERFKNYGSQFVA